MIKAGTLTESVLIERKTKIQGNVTSVSTAYDWSTLMTTRASVLIMSGEDQIRSGKQEASNRIKVIMRNRSNVKIQIGDRITWNNKTWLIDTAPIIDPRRQKIESIAIDEFVQT